VVCLAPRAPADSVRPRRPAGEGARPLNFTVRARVGLKRAGNHREMNYRATIRQRSEDPKCPFAWRSRVRARTSDSFNSDVGVNALQFAPGGPRAHSGFDGREL
jgi:hypothetical protein